MYVLSQKQGPELNQIHGLISVSFQQSMTSIQVSGLLPSISCSSIALASLIVSLSYEERHVRPYIYRHEHQGRSILNDRVHVCNNKLQTLIG